MIRQIGMDFWIISNVLNVAAIAVMETSNSSTEIQAGFYVSTVKIMKQIKVEIIKEWLDIDWRFKPGETMDVYDDPGDFYWICIWGWRIIPKDHCKLIESTQ